MMKCLCQLVGGPDVIVKPVEPEDLRHVDKRTAKRMLKHKAEILQRLEGY